MPTSPRLKEIFVEVACASCGKLFTRSAWSQRNTESSKRRPVCSKSCGGRLGGLKTIRKQKFKRLSNGKLLPFIEWFEPG